MKARMLLAVTIPALALIAWAGIDAELPYDCGNLINVADQGYCVADVEASDCDMRTDIASVNFTGPNDPIDPYIRIAGSNGFSISCVDPVEQWNCRELCGDVDQDGDVDIADFAVGQLEN